jgi:hypothetical protein
LTELIFTQVFSGKYFFGVTVAISRHLLIVAAASRVAD